MNELHTRVKELMLSGLNCSQTMLFLANESRGIDNPDAVRAIGGLGGGMFSGANCGTITGGAAVLALYGASSEPGDEASYDYRSAVVELKEWFEHEFGSIECKELVSTDKMERIEKCPGLVAKTFEKCLEILDKYQIDPYMQ